ncbi:flagellar hook-associated protein FlgL [Alcanivorax sp. S71-1-4]|uniref:flagellar hook-associated protein FlgL n=1 Tax=Alcanivorax sp. S71-1-4 TaxID=1177159 RepID=UPI0013598D21|nr:flagellar hook-associated protein FlgL [Alcanivorax sp. S71-1-4]KAF0810577.1 flagellar hook-associated protein FlgL [Alcanivorax sp. S71-1-4]
MRISTVTMFEQSVSSLNRQQADFMKVGQQIASGRRVVNPSDDPQAASRAVRVAQSQALTQQFTDARVTARNALSQEESVLNSVGDAIASARTLVLQAVNGTLADADRDSVASELRGIYETVLGQANATDGNGRYLFGGYRDSSPPFVRDPAGDVQYVGDTRTREQRIDASRLMPVGDNGDAIFRSVHSSAGYLAEADAGNTGSLTFAGPDAVNAADPDYGSRLDITFAVAGDVTTYIINGGPAQPYTPAQPIQHAGLSFTFEGQPADGDSVVMDRAENMNTDLFATFEKVLSVLENPATSASDKAALNNTLNSALREMDNSLDNVLTVRASVGARLNELEVVDAVASNRQLNYAEAMSDLVELDYVSAISEYTLRQVGLQAAQKAFVDIKGMTLFDRL